MKHGSINMRSDAFGFLLVGARLLLLFGLASVIYFAKDIHVMATVLIYYVYCVVWNFSSWTGLGHELSHGTVFRTRFFNQFFFAALSYLTISNEELFLVTHAEHHREPHGLTDFETPYRETLPATSFSCRCMCAFFDVAKLFNLLRYHCLNSQGIVPSQKLDLLVEKRSKKKLVARAALKKLAYLSLVLIVSVVNLSAWPVLFLIIPNFVGTSLSRNLALIQHPSLATLARLNVTTVNLGSATIPVEHLSHDVIRDGIDVLLPGVIRFLYASMNFHASHHASPSIPFYRLEGESRLLKDKGKICIARISWLVFPRLLLAPL